MKRNFTIKKVLMTFLIIFSFLSNSSIAQNDHRTKPVKASFKLKIKDQPAINVTKNTSLVGCSVDSTQNGFYSFLDSTGAQFNGYLCGANDSVSGTVANGFAFYDGDGYKIKLIQGSQVTFSVGADSCAVHPVSLTLCDSANIPIPGAYVSSGCASLNFTATYTGVFIVVINENGICGGGGAVGIGEIFCYQQAGTTLPTCLASPANDTLCGAFPLIIGGPFYTGDNSTANSSDNDDLKATTAGFVCSIPNNTLWYSFTPTVTENVTVVYSSTASSGLLGWLGVFDAPTCADPLANGMCYTGPAGTGDTVNITIPVVAGTTYYFMIDGNSGAVGGFGIGVVSAQPFPINDTICGATSLVLDGPIVFGNTANALGTDPLDASVTTAGYTCSTPNNTEWFEYTPAVSDSFDLVMSANGGGFDAWIAPFSTPAGVGACQGVLTYESTDCLNGPNNTYATGPTGPTGDTAVNRLYLTVGNTYYFMIDGYAGAVGSYSIGIHSVVTMGVNEFESNIRSLSIYPNPANEELNINYNFFNAENVAFQLIDLTGRVILNDSGSGIKNGTKTINVKNINNGIYLLRLSGAKGNSSRKIMIQH